MRRVSVTEAVRNFADLVNRVFYQGLRYRLIRGGREVAELSPPAGSSSVSAADLRAALERMPHLGVEEAEELSKDIDRLRRAAGSSPETSWE